VELPKVYVVYLKRGDIFEGEQGDCSVKWKLLVPRDETGFVIRREPQARDLSKSRIEISQIFLKLGLLFLCLGFAVGSDTERRPKRRHA
jgi:hypothetical protein